MRKIIYYLFIMLFSLSATMVSAGNPESEKETVTTETEKKLSDEEIEHIKERVHEIRKMDKSELTADEKRELRKELKEMKKELKKADGGIYIGGATLILLIILIILVA